jgi:hypothetical protein
LNMTAFLSSARCPGLPRLSLPERFDAPGQQPTDCKATITFD